jgi:hypothetical protein
MANAGAAVGSGGVSDALFRELWHACAGPLVTVPRQGELVYYFPQGHMEQLEASTDQQLDQHLPLFNLPSKILCKVVNVELRAETDSDEVYAQIMLQPEADVSRITYIIFLWISIFSFCYCLFVLYILYSISHNGLPFFQLISLAIPHDQYYICMC